MYTHVPFRNLLHLLVVIDLSDSSQGSAHILDYEEDTLHPLSDSYLLACKGVRLGGRG